MAGGSELSESWFEISLRADVDADVDERWSENFEETYCCRECTSRRPEFAGEQVTVYLNKPPPNAPILSLFPVPAGIIRRDIVALFRDAGEGYWVLGELFGPNGETYPDFVTFTAPYSLEKRGGPSSLQRPCGSCGYLRYWPLPHGYEYIAATCLRPGRRLYLTGSCGMIITRDLLMRIDLKTRKKLRIKELPVKERPEDGIEGFPTIWL